MAKVIGVCDKINNFKQLALLFDQILLVMFEPLIAFHKYQSSIEDENKKQTSYFLDELLWLEENNILCRIPKEIEKISKGELINDILKPGFLENFLPIYTEVLSETSKHYSLLSSINNSLTQVFENEINPADRIQIFDEHFLALYKYVLFEADFTYLKRMFSTLLNFHYDDEYIPISDKHNLFPPNNKLEKQSVLNVIIKSFPSPDDSTPWENILEFRKDPDSKAKLLALKRWINNLTKSNLNIKEVEQEIEFRISEYEKHMKYHQIKCSQSRIETIVVTSAEILEDIINLKFSKIAKVFFELKKENLELLEAEINNPHSQVAYIVKAQKQFNH